MIFKKRPAYMIDGAGEAVDANHPLLKKET